METIWSNRLIRETSCILYIRLILTEGEGNMTIYAFKHDEFRCEMEIFNGFECKSRLADWLKLPVDTAVSY